MKNNERSVHISVLKISLVVLAVILAIIFVLKVSRHYIEKMTVDDSSSSIKTTTSPTQKGTFSLASATGRTIFLPQEAIQVNLIADSKNVVVSGYDVLFEALDPAVTLTSAKSSVDYFDVRVIDSKKGWVNGAMKLQENSEGFAFDSSEIAQLFFMHSGQGLIELSIDFAPGETRDSNMMQINPPEDILSEVQGITLYTGSKVKLAPNGTYIVPQSSISLTLKKLTVPEGLCNDCSTQAEVEIKKGKDVQNITFLLGGMQGKITDTHEVLGYIFETTSITKDGIEIYSAKTGDTYEK